VKTSNCDFCGSVANSGVMEGHCWRGIVIRAETDGGQVRICQRMGTPEFLSASRDGTCILLQFFFFTETIIVGFPLHKY
jgi:hypothetical protein